MVDLPWDLEWVEATVQEDLLDYEGWTPMGVGRAVSAEHLERFSGVFPESVLYVWRRFGFDGFGQGRFWITDPWEWEPVVEAWLEGMALPFPPQRWWCLARTAMGGMSLWGEVSGPALEITPVLGILYPDAARASRMADPVLRERMGCSVFTSPTKDSLDDDDTGRPIVDGVIERLGAVGPDQVVGFVPAYCLTGVMTVGSASLEEAVPHLVFLAQAQDKTLWEDFSAAAAQAAAAIAIQHPDPSTGPGPEPEAGPVPGSEPGPGPDAGPEPGPGPAPEPGSGVDGSGAGGSPRL
ncbi:GAD-like domain-containing protein [Actinomyces howellii]|uniref:GAD-like domain-containing protein n=1 Tax=Actinomyces howellii TaxID=52771 RepID=UPI000F837DEC|nr:GAD-like domain-containing protein [Actinomyces howellii]